MALADKVFFGIDSIDELYDQQINEGEDEMIFAGKTRLQICFSLETRRCKKAFRESLPKATFERIFKKVLQ